MLVEFPSIIYCPEEQFKKEQERELQGTYSVSNFNEHDILLPVVINMEDVIGWECIKIYFNSKIVTVIRAYIEGDEYASKNLFVSNSKFRMIWEKVNKQRIHTDQTILEDES